ncbi:hypothetical protein HYU16_00225 [Candidatus Woesearchaeota archaeon]|nr:hypothetical protein [Candidatus Woesearchaeota archaeon]
MPITLLNLVYGLVAGFIGSLVMAIIMMAMGKSVKASPPGIIAEKFLGDESKKPMVLMPVMAIWGLIFAAVAGAGLVKENYVGGLIVAVVAWLLLGIVMLPMAGAGLFGMKKWGMIPMMSLVMHIIWALVAVTVFGFLKTITG